MGIIHILPEHEVHKIAAGQVVERPASVVKELLENALDAGATTIIVSAREGGKRSIRIVDNGCGMDLEDAHTCLKNHATSKISSVEDLEQIATFGFRGEALATIAAVSRFTIKTREKSSDTGIELVTEGGTIIAENVAACPVGTDITVEELFFNTPGRQKFLKKDETEWRAIQQLFVASALQHHTCSFTLHHDDRQAIHAPAVQTSLERMAQLLGTDLARDLVTCKTSYEPLNLTIEGILARPMHHRYDKNQIYVFVNRRPVRNHKLISALIRGYNNILPVGQNPVAALFITIDPREIDVNIHPRKEEVLFAHPVMVERCIQEMVEKTLNKDVGRGLGTPDIAPTFAPARPWQPSAEQYGAYTAPANTTTEHVEADCAGSCQEQEESFFVQNLGPAASTDTQQNAITAPQNNYQLLGQLLNTYLVIETDESIVLIDQHAAHERVLYELFNDRFNEKASTQLIFPLIINVSHDENTVLTSHLQVFQDYGIDIEPFGSHAFAIRSVPVYLKNAPFEHIIKTFLSWIDEEKPVTTDDFARLLNEKLRALMACKAAIKAGDRLTTQEMHELVNKLMACEQKTTCPHGRPTTYRLTKYEIEKIFQRCS